jgi:hypothetical protein
MDQTVLSTITSLVKEFTPNHMPTESSVKLDDTFIHAFDLLQGVKHDERDTTIKQALRLYSEERHYSLNIATLLCYFHYYLNNYRQDEHVQWDFHSRLTLDVEQLVTNVRSFLDATYRLALLFSDEAMEVRGKKRESFGKFAEWSTRTNIAFARPLSFLTEVIPWGLTIRRVRDDYIHRGLEAEPFWDHNDVYFYPYLFHRNVRPMPDSFYCSNHSGVGSLKPIYLRKFVVYAAAPVIALELVLGRYLTELFTARYGPWPSYDYGCPFSANLSTQALYDLILQNTECLEGSLYQTTYFT